MGGDRSGGQDPQQGQEEGIQLGEGGQEGLPGQGVEQRSFFERRRDPGGGGST